MSNTLSPAPNGEALRKTAARWLERINDAQTHEKNWRDDAEKATKAYTGEGRQSEDSQAVEGVAYDFNILFANVETIVPAVINSPPAPDVRRRFGSDDPVAKDFSELLERSMRVQIDDGKLQVELEAMAQDGFLAGRGIIRIRFKSDFTGGEGERSELQGMERNADESSEAPDGTAAHEDAESVTVEAREGSGEPQEEQQANERIEFEAVSWRDFARGPAKRWADVPWIAFRHSMPAEDLNGFSDIPLLTAQTDESTAAEADDGADREVWEIWDRRTKTVLFVAVNGGKIVKQVEDPLSLSSFFPIATPVQPIELTGRLMPVNPFSLYRRLADELDVTTKRIRIITKQLKVKGWYGMDAADLAALLVADDNEFVPISDPGLWAENGGIAGAIAFWPIEKLVPVLAELQRQREQTKQSIYEITGISDIVRGASKAAETLGAQQIKAQWGSLRIQKMQRMMERAARDLFLMMAEIIPAKFSPASLTRMTEIQIDPTPEDLQPVQMPAMPQMQPGQQMDQALAEQMQQAQSQAQAAEAERSKKLQHLGQLKALMGERAATYYRIDVETDSTVKADLTRQKQEATEFLTAAGGYFQAVAPMIDRGALPLEVAVEIFSSFSRMFNLGKSVEDALDELVEQARAKSEGASDEEDPSKAAAAAAQAASEAEAKAKQAEGDIKVQVSQIGLEVAKVNAAAQTQAAEVEAQSKLIEQNAKRTDLQIKQVDLQIKEVDLQIKRSGLLAPIPALDEGMPNGL